MESVTAHDKLFSAAYNELKALAGQLRRGEQRMHTLNTTALVNEAYLRLRTLHDWQDHQHYLRIAARAMRQVMVDHARARLSQKRQHEKADEAGLETVGTAANDEWLIDLDQSLQDLEAFNPRLARVVEYRFFAAYTDAEIAELLGLNERTLRRDWAKARSWLNLHLQVELPA